MRGRFGAPSTFGWWIVETIHFFARFVETIPLPLLRFVSHPLIRFMDMRSNEEFEAVVGLCKAGLNDSQVSRLTGIPLSTVRRMRVDGRVGNGQGRNGCCPICQDGVLRPSVYAYLLGLYLGDGSLSECAGDVYRLEIGLDQKYPRIIDSCAEAIERFCEGSGPASRRNRPGCVIVYRSWKHWPCVFPQHGPGQKWTRDVSLVYWQDEIARANPDALLRGLIQSDGSRDENWVKAKSYPRYQFVNNSFQIQEIFTTACERVGVHWARTFWKTISIARRSSVAKLDQIVGPKC